MKTLIEWWRIQTAQMRADMVRGVRALSLLVRGIRWMGASYFLVVSSLFVGGHFALAYGPLTPSHRVVLFYFVSLLAASPTGPALYLADAISFGSTFPLEVPVGLILLLVQAGFVQKVVDRLRARFCHGRVRVVPVC